MLWNGFIIIMMLISIVTVIYPRFIEKFITLQNQIKGVKTEITPMTIKFARISAIFCIFVGLLLLIFANNYFR